MLRPWVLIISWTVVEPSFNCPSYGEGGVVHIYVICKIIYVVHHSVDNNYITRDSSNTEDIPSTNSSRCIVQSFIEKIFVLDNEFIFHDLYSICDSLQTEAIL